MTVFVVGRFPPPFDGQALATQRVADLLDTRLEVRRFNTEPPESKVAVHAGLSLARVRHFLELRPRLTEELGRTPSVVLWHSISPDPLGHFRDLLTTLPAFRDEQRVYAVVHRGNFKKLFTSLATTATARWLVDQIEGIVFVSEQLKTQCAPWLPDSKRFVIPYTIDEDILFEDHEIERKIDERMNRGSLRILYLSNMIRTKGYHDVLGAIPLIRSRGEIHAHFVGAWEREEDRLAFAKDVGTLGVDDLVTHHGPLTSRTAIKKMYEQCDVLVLPTYYPNEAQPLVILEALNAGLPIISTRHGSIAEVIRDGKDGFLVPPREPGQIADAVGRLFDRNTWREMSLSARSRFLNRHSPDRVRSLWLDLISAERT